MSLILDIYSTTKVHIDIRPAYARAGCMDGLAMPWHELLEASRRCQEPGRTGPSRWQSQHAGATDKALQGQRIGNAWMYAALERLRGHPWQLKIPIDTKLNHY